MNCRNEYSHCTGGHNCPARATPLVDASRKALAVLSLTGADPALQDEMVGAIAEPDRRVAELTAQRDELLAALKSLEYANDRRAELVTSADYIKQMKTNGMSEALEDLDIARRAARAAIAKHQPTAAPAANTP